MDHFLGLYPRLVWFAPLVLGMRALTDLPRQGSVRSLFLHDKKVRTDPMALGGTGFVGVGTGFVAPWG